MRQNQCMYGGNDGRPAFSQRPQLVEVTGAYDDFEAKRLDRFQHREDRAGFGCLQEAAISSSGRAQPKC